jgi:hypothetical protein
MTSHSVGIYHSLCQLYTRYLLVSAVIQRLKFERGRMQQMSTKMQQIIEWLRAKVMELLSKGESNQSINQSQESTIF